MTRCDGCLTCGETSRSYFRDQSLRTPACVQTYVVFFLLLDRFYWWISLVHIIHAYPYFSLLIGGCQYFCIYTLLKIVSTSLNLVEALPLSYRLCNHWYRF